MELWFNVVREPVWVGAHIDAQVYVRDTYIVRTHAHTMLNIEPEAPCRWQACSGGSLFVFCLHMPC